jgi:hypothetical protein
MNYRKKQRCFYDGSLPFADCSTCARLIFHSAKLITNRKTANGRRNYREGLASTLILALVAGFAFFIASASAVVAAEVPNISVLDQGANGGNGTSLPALGTDGDNGVNGGNVAANLSGSDFIITVGNSVSGISARSVGGNGGNGGDGYGFTIPIPIPPFIIPVPGFGGDGGTGAGGATVTVNSAGNITTSGTNAHGVFAENRGGNGGDGGDGEGILAVYAEGGDGGAGGSAGTVTVDNSGAIVTNGTGSQGILAQSLGGAGGDGGGGGALTIVGNGGAAAGSGPGGNVTVTNSGTITTHSADARGIFAESVGGYAGEAGAGVGIVGFGGSANSAGNGGVVTATNSGAITTSGARSDSIFAQSVGGGGGDGGGSGGLFSFGGLGSAGGDGGAVTVNNTGALQTGGVNSSGLFAQSVGGGGGNGGGSISASAFAGFSLGGSGGTGGSGGEVNVSSGSTTILTSGERAHGIVAQSVGGGGGNGGYAVTLTGGIGGSVSVAVGGSGGDGGGGGVVHVDNASSITTGGQDAMGIFVQSVGGGGGSGGFSISGAGSDGIGVSISYGGSGGGGGSSSAVTITNTGATISTSGDRSIGIFAQSLGGGGGNGGFSIAGSGGGLGALSFSLGGSGGDGGNGSSVGLTSSGNITTHGVDAYGIFAQSVGGGGGNGGFSITGAGAGTGALSLGIGGFGGGGAIGSSVTVTSTGALIQTFGDRSTGILAQSLGGGGGNGSFSIAGAGAGTGAGTFSLGGSGGDGGNADAVNLTSSSSITTHGADAYGIFAQSLGGGGGNGGFSIAGAGAGTGAGTLGIGGFGAGGGIGKAVTVSSTGALIQTSGDRSTGIVAQSLGGGGGNGGFSIAGAGAGTGAGTFSLGGAGAGGGNADTVNLTSSSSITTHGMDAYGILAQSLGGGGGNGGFSIAGAGAGTGAGTINVGGFGGGGGASASVTATSTGTLIETFGARSSGIFAQSLGGGGGNGSFSIAASGAGTGSGTLGLGGFAGGGGSASTVTVNSGGSIVTHANEAYGIFAQSLGGGGGNGGFSIAGSGAGDGAGSLSIGGFGGGGGDSDVVTVHSTGVTISTFGAGATGIVAQSLGGGGGNGNFSIAASGADRYSFNFSLGGSGGDGGLAKAVNVTSDTSITTQGEQAHGIFAQSQGGGGGNGGFSGTFGFTAGTQGEMTNVVSGLAIGGHGGDGKVGGAVNVTTTGDVTTLGPDSNGIIAMSIGGGGGNGGSSLAVDIGTSAAQQGRRLAFTGSVGGFGGNGNVGGTVLVDNGGDIETSADNSNGIFALSIGGGGGNGGDSRTFTLLATDPKTTVINFYNMFRHPLTGTSVDNNWSFDVSIGGSGGTGSNGGTVTVSNDGNIITRGAMSRGIQAASVGGGGGNGGDGIFGTGTPADLTLLASQVGILHNWTLTVGGSGGANGDAAQVTVNNTGDITTMGFASHGIFAQSVGGGGGEAQIYAEALDLSGGSGSAGTTVTGVTAKIGIGGLAGVGGNGGIVGVNHIGNIATFGDDAYGIFAQSVGGGGGNAGSVQRGLGSLDVGLGLNFSRCFFDPVNPLSHTRCGNGGDGGAVTINSQGTITTQGAGAHGIFAQSIGGGGGNAGGLGTGPQDLLPVNFSGSVGGDGNGGAVVVNHTGNIYTSGDDANGIFAQSAGGTGTGSSVDVTLHGDITASGSRSFGIFAQSRGDAGAGNISINIKSTVQGGTGTVSVTTGDSTPPLVVPASGIAMFDGANNSVTNHGTITTLGGVAGNAIFATTGNDKIDNHGTVTGSVDLGSGNNAFNNKIDATFNSGATINLGTGNLLSNEGTLSPGARGTIYTAVLSGNLVQTNSGTYAVDLDVGSVSGNADRVNGTGTANLAGLTDVNPVNAGFALPGSHQVTILSAAGGVTDSGLSLMSPPSAVINYQLLFPNPTDVDLGYSIDFAPSGLNINQTMIGKYINRVQLAGGSASLEPIVEALFFIPNASGLASAYDHLSPEPYVGLATGTFFSNLQFSDSMLSCRSRDGQYRFIREGQCGWMTVSGSALHEERTSENLGFNRNGFSVAGGLQKQINENWHVGVGIGYDKSWLDVHGIAESDAHQLQGGALVKGQFGPAIFSVAVSGGHGWYDAKRFVNLPVTGITAKADPGINFVANRLRLAYAFEQPAWYLKPMIDAGVTYVNLGGFQESGAAGANLNVRSQNETYVTLQPALEIGGELGRKEGTLFRPFARVGLIHLFTGDSPGITASMQGAPAGVTPFTVKGKNDRNTGEVSLGVDILGVKGMNLRVGYTGQFSPRSESHGGAIKFSIPF